MLPVLPRRRGRRLLCVGLAVLVVSGVATALVPVGPAAARSRRADLAVTGMVAGPAQVLMDEIVGIGVTVTNVGTRVAESVTVHVTLPATLQPPSPGGLGFPWSCDALAPGWRCTHGPLAPGQSADELQVNARVVGGTPGDVLTVTAEASTTSRELSIANNTGQASVTLIGPGTIRGTAWIDADRDGQREPGEPAAPGFGLWEVRVLTEDGSGEILPVEVDAEGHYSLAVKPNQYLVEVTIGVHALAWDFTTPNVGDEATDSDVVPVFADEFSSIARSHVFEMVSGSETVIDIGLTEEPLT
jgi:Domain of unknown function DUF11/SdrD B-like domain